MLNDNKDLNLESEIKPEPSKKKNKKKNKKNKEESYVDWWDQLSYVVWDVLKAEVKKWSCGELNPRPLECKSSALPTELQPQSLFLSLTSLTFQSTSIHY